MPIRQSYRDVSADPFLSNFSVAHWQDTSVFVGTRYFPIVPVTVAAGKYTTYPQGYFNRPVNSKRAEEGRANTIGYKTKQASYMVDDDAIRIFISDKARANVSNGQNLDMEAAMVTTDAILINKEVEFVDKFLQPNRWTQTYTGADATPGTDQFLKWSDAGSDPIADISSKATLFSLASGGKSWNKALMTQDVFQVLSQHPAILDRVVYGGTNAAPANITAQALAALLGVQELEIMRSIVNTAQDGLEDANGNPVVQNEFMASGKLMLNYVAPTAGLLQPVAAAGFLWNNFIPAGVDNGPTVRRYPGVEGKRGEYIEAEIAIDVEMVSPDMGILFDNAV